MIFLCFVEEKIYKKYIINFNYSNSTNNNLNSYLI